MIETSVDGAGGHAKVVGPWQASVEAAAVQKALLDFFGTSWTARGPLIRGLVTSERLPEC